MRGHLWRVGMTMLVLGACLAGSPPAHAATPGEDPTPRQAQAVASVLLSADRASRAAGSRARLVADLEAGPAGGSCYAGTGGWTCDAWFTTDQTGVPYPNGVSITVAPTSAAARALLARRAVEAADRPDDRVLASTTSLLATLATGLAVGPDLTPAVAISVETIRGRFIIMGTCQVEQRRLQLRGLRACADRLVAAQALRAAGLRL